MADKSIFISHSHNDTETVENIIDLIKNDR